MPDQEGTRTDGTPQAWIPGLETVVVGVGSTIASEAATAGIKRLTSKADEPFLIRVIELYAKDNRRGWIIDVVNQSTSGAAIMKCRLNANVETPLFALPSQQTSFGASPQPPPTAERFPIHLAAAQTSRFLVDHPEFNVKKACELALTIHPYNAARTGDITSLLAMI